MFVLLSSPLAAQITRVANTTLTLPQTPQTFGYATEDAFAGLTFDQPLAIVTAPGETNRVFVVEKTGRIQVVTGLDTTPVKQVFLDLSARVLTSSEMGLLGLAFHPDFATNHYFYVFYSLNATTSAGTGTHERVARFTALTGSPTNAQLLATELPLISQRDEADNHNGGDMHFGPDGYLYIALGDEGGGNDQFNNSQRIDKDFFAGLLRIDVDQRAGNLTPNAHPSVHAGTYKIPADNPFVGVTTYNGLAVTPASVHTEFWATGLRNPWRFSFDFPTNRLLLGDVGQGAREEIDLITRGGNYGWNFREGTIAGPRSSPPVGATFIDPIWDADRSTASSITGGVVYRGTRFAQLYGKYVFGDYGAGRLFIMTFPESGPVQVANTMSVSSPVGFGTDPRNGDVLIASIGSGKVLRLIYNTTATGTPLPATLTGTGAFTSLATLTPAPGIVAYDPNVSFWSDYAKKRRWFSVPTLANKITFAAEGNWTFPAGTVWVKHFDLELTRGNPATARRLETRFIVKTAGGVYGVTYKWNSAQTEATLVAEAGETETIAINDGGTIRPQTWRYPSRSECLQCHTPVGGHALSFNTAQLNRSVAYGGTSANQLEALAAAGYFTVASVPAHTTLPALAPADDSTATAERRVRSYLAANCISCHQPGGAAQGNWDARYSTPTANAGLINGALVDPRGDAANRVLAPTDPTHSMMLARISTRGSSQMPPLASNELDTANIALLVTWINDLGAPVITMQPASQSAVLGTNVSFTSVVTSSLDLFTYQWRKNGTSISGATSSTLTLSNVAAGDAANYDVVVTNALGSTTSVAASLTVDAGTVPSGFDVSGYLARYPAVAAVYGSDPYGAWLHYRNVGIYQGEVFDDNFRVEEYLVLYPELSAIFGGDYGSALEHWLSTGRIEGRLGRIPLVFSAAGYFTRNPDVATAVNNDAILAWGHFWLYGIYEGRAYDDEFRVFEYLAINADLQAAYLSDWRGGTLHWMRYGRTEGRLGRIPLVFNVTEYLNRYPEVAVSWGTYPTTVWLHFWLYGIDEGRTFDEEFRVDEYLARYPDLQAVFGTDRRGAFMHWVRYGKAEGRLGRNP